MTTEEAVGRKDVVILGAGFSHAVSWRMPLVTELGQMVLAQLQAERKKQGDRIEQLLKQLERAMAADSDTPGSAGFESWLARLAEDQPHLSQRENLERRVLFSRVSEVLWETMVGLQKEALVSGVGTDDSRLPKEWLYDIVALFHQRQSTVITLNYDNLVEHAVLYAQLWGDATPLGRGRNVRVDDLYEGLPALQPSLPGPARARPATISSSAPSVETLRLVKLHGSLSWFWNPRDEAGSTLAAWNVNDFGESLGDQQTRRRDLPGREPFLVPPTTSKASYFETMVTRELWRRAHEALEDADRVVLVGYSLPAADSTFLGLLADSIVDRDIEVVVVNTKPKPVEGQLVRLGVDPANISSMSSVADWVEGEVANEAEAVVKRLRQWSMEDPAIVANARLNVSLNGLPQPVDTVDFSSSREELIVSIPRDLTAKLTPVTLQAIASCLNTVKRLCFGDRQIAITGLGEPKAPREEGQLWSLNLRPLR